MTPSEFSRVVDANRLPTAPLELVASAEEMAALARRFGLVAVRSLSANVRLDPIGEAIVATGRLRAEIVQSCAISGEDLPVAIDEPLSLRFVREAPVAASEGDEVELAAGELDEVPFDGDAFDLGEQVAQTLGLAIDPYAAGPDAERARREAGLLDEAASGPFAALAALKKSD